MRQPNQQQQNCNTLKWLQTKTMAYTCISDLCLAWFQNNIHTKDSLHADC